jgi:sigma-B regulation protein RsbU (phosphoserine phosphatase)
MATPLRALVIEDSPEDATLLLLHLEKAGFDVVHERVESEPELRAALRRQSWDVVLSDFAMPHFDGLSAFEIVRAWRADLPFILVSGHIGEERAAEAMKQGAHDYVLKTNLARLAPAITRELQDAEVRKQRRQMSEELRRTEKNYRNLVNGSLQGIAIEQDGRIVFSNPAFERTFGYGSLEELQQLPDFTHLFAEPDREKAGRYLGTRSKSRGAPEIAELEGLRADGSSLWLHVTAWSTAWNGAPALQFATLDVTELKRAQEQVLSQQRLLQTVFDSLPVWVAVKDRLGRYVLANREFEKSVGAAPGTLTGKTHRDLGIGSADELERMERLDRDVLESGRVVEDSAVTQDEPDGPQHRFHVVRAPLRDRDGLIEGLVVVTQDITLLKRT